MSTPFEYVDAGDMIQPDTTGPGEQWLDAEIERRWGNEQGAEPGIVLRAIALDLFTEAAALRATEQNLREQLAQPCRHDLQAQGKHPAPCARLCEAQAFMITIRGLERDLEAMRKDQK